MTSSSGNVKQGEVPGVRIPKRRLGLYESARPFHHPGEGNGKILQVRHVAHDLQYSFGHSGGGPHIVRHQQHAAAPAELKNHVLDVILHEWYRRLLAKIRSG